MKISKEAKSVSRETFFRKKGFTLVEMVVTLVIIVTLSLLSFPLYEARTSNSSKLAEGYVLLGTIISAQLSYYNEYGNFLSHLDSWLGAGYSSNAWTENDPVLGINAINNRYFTRFNAYFNPGTGTRYPYAYHFTAVVASNNAGTIYLEYNLTKRSEPVVSGI